ncbi:MAG: hypothetical protein KDE59_12960, partial [Anaerolineales bacterium]|nr:hypothetical protein [Anaerolineales bacterium]
MFRPAHRLPYPYLLLFMILLGIILLPATAAPVAAAPELGGTLPLDVTVSDLLSSPGQSQLYAVDVAGADRLVIRLLVISGNLDPALALRDPGGNLLCDGASLGAFVELNCPVAGAGSYTVVVSDGQNDGTGNFNLYAQAVQQPAGAVALALDTTATTVLSPDGEMDAFTLTGSSGQTLLIRLLATSGDLDPAFRLFRPDGTELCSGSTLGSFVDTLCFLDVTGPYTLFVADGNGAGTGNYNLYAQNLQTPANAQTLTLDESQSAPLAPAGEADSYQFAGQSGERLLVRLLATSGDLDPAFRLFRLDGTQLCSGSTLGSFVETLCSLDMTGQYHLIVADGNGAGTGSYNLYLQALIDPANGLPLNLDVPEAASLS